MVYIVQTYLLNLILLNILIAVTGDVYDQFKDNAKAQIGLMRIIKIHAYRLLLKNYTEHETEEVYLFIV